MAGWNGSGMGSNSTPVKPKVTAKKPSPVRGLVAGLLVAALAAGAYFAFFSGSERPQKVVEEKKPTRIKEVTPAPAPKAVKEEPKVEKKKIKTKGAHAIIDGTNNVQKLPNGDFIVTDADGSRTLVATRHWEPPCQHITSNNFERVLMLYAVPGEDVPPVPTDSYTKKDVEDALVSRVEFNDDDWEETRIRKEGIEELKALFRQELKAGKSPQEFIRDLQARQAKEAYTVKTSKEMIINSLREDNVEEARALADKLNEHLGKQGIPPVKLPIRYRKVLYPEQFTKGAETQK